VRQERIGLHMADAISRVTSGRKIGAFCMQHGPGSENAYGGVAQAYGESVPVLVVPMGYPRRLATSTRTSTPPCRCAGSPRAPSPSRSRRRCRTSCAAPSPGCGTAAAGRCWWRCPPTCGRRNCPDRLDYEPVLTARSAPDPADVKRAAALAGRERQASGDLRRHRACTGRGLAAVAPARGTPGRRPSPPSLGGKSSFPENAPALLAARRPRRLQAGAALPGQRRCGVRRRMQLHRDQFRREDAEGARASSTPHSTRCT
jgi:acetolactate synthase-1/2/3 large subunit